MNHSMRAVHRQRKSAGRILTAFLCLFFAATGAWAQSTEIDLPTPVRASEINGVILPRDIGDPRPTRHFYALTGTPGDLTITVESKNLDGDVDLFTAGTLRPLAKISMYAGEAVTSASKSIYLKRRESLVLRVEARSPNEAQGGYRIRFEGGFEPFSGAEAQTETPASPAPDSTAERTDKKTRRVTSVGARIEEPATPAETGRTAEPAPTASPRTPEPSEKASASPPHTAPTETATTAEPSAARRRSPGRTVRNSRAPRPSTTRQPKPAPPAAESKNTRPEPVQPEAEPGREAKAAPVANPRLIIETRDGMRVERFMTNVRRVTVEAGQVVVVTKDGKVERHPLTNILRMSIEP